MPEHGLARPESYLAPGVPIYCCGVPSGPLSGYAAAWRALAGFVGARYGPHVKITCINLFLDVCTEQSDFGVNFGAFQAAERCEFNTTPTRTQYNTKPRNWPTLHLGR